MKKKILKWLSPFIAAMMIIGCSKAETKIQETTTETVVETTEETKSSLEWAEAEYMHAVKSHDGSETIPVYFGEQFIDLNEGVPYFTQEHMTTEMFEVYSSLDGLGRCGRAFANVCWETLPREKRGEIGSVKPSGWMHNGKSNNNKYEWVDGSYVINRCHLLAYETTGENANEANLITGTRSMNLAMLPYENEITQYVKETENHVLYRVTPIFYEDELMAQGVEMEGYSVEDKGEGINFHIFVYNVEPGVVFDYKTGQNWAADGSIDPEKDGYESALGTYRDKDGNIVKEPETAAEENERLYVLNINSGKVHLPECENAEKIAEKNRQEFSTTLEKLLEDGYSACQNCLKGH